MNLKIVFTRVAYAAYWLVAPLCIEATENQVYRLDSDSELVLCQWLGSDLQNDSGEPDIERLSDLGMSLGKCSAKAEIQESTGSEIPVRKILLAPVPSLAICFAGCSVHLIGSESKDSVFGKAYRLGAMQAVEEAAKGGMRKLPTDLQLSDIHRLRLQIQAEPEPVSSGIAEGKLAGDPSTSNSNTR